MHFSPPNKWFGPGQKLGHRAIYPQTWEGWVVLLSFIGGIWAAGILLRR